MKFRYLIKSVINHFQFQLGAAGSNDTLQIQTWLILQIAFMEKFKFEFQIWKASFVAGDRKSICPKNFYYHRGVVMAARVPMHVRGQDKRR